MTKMRLDKLLANSGHGSRSEVKVLARSGRVTVAGKAIRDPGLLVDPEQQSVCLDDKPVYYRQYYYLMLNKPAGPVSATRDNLHQTVLDLVPYKYQHLDLFPVGRLDRDTQGLLVLTNDGKLAHRLLAPKKHVPKTYHAQVQGEVTPEDVEQFAAGLALEDFTTLPAVLEIKATGAESEVLVTIHEGKYHQVKRMFAAVGKKVLGLKRISMGNLKLDPALAPGEIRELTQPELAILESWR